ncbi:MAG: hypothetical protein AAGG38_11420 [Planctomycetota bacterium]
MTALNPADKNRPLTPAALLSKNHFLLRRLHSLSGIVPIGVFVIGHLFTNAQMIWGQDGGPTGTGEGTFQHEVDFIHNLPYLLFIELSLWGAIAFHAGLGLWYTFTGKHNVKAYGYTDNVRYLLQRITGIIALVFIFLHIATLRWRWDIFGWFTPFYGEGYQAGSAHAIPEHLHHVPMSLPLTAYALQVSWLVVALYAVGVIASIYHWSNGLWTAAISWGLTITTASMRRWGYVCVGLFLALMLFFGAAMAGALAFDLSTDMTPEQTEVFLLIVEDPQVEIGMSGK